MLTDTRLVFRLKDTLRVLTEDSAFSEDGVNKVQFGFTHDLTLISSITIGYVTPPAVIAIQAEVREASLLPPLLILFILCFFSSSSSFLPASSSSSSSYSSPFFSFLLSFFLVFNLILFLNSSSLQTSRYSIAPLDEAKVESAPKDEKAKEEVARTLKTFVEDVIDEKAEVRED